MPRSARSRCTGGFLEEQSRARIAALEAAPRGSTFTAQSFEQVDDNWWFLGDDFRDVRKRELIKRYFDLRGVIFRGIDLDTPLGLSDVHLVPHVMPGNTIAEGFGARHDQGARRRVAREGVPQRDRGDARAHAGDHAPRARRRVRGRRAGSCRSDKLVVGTWDRARGYIGWGGKIARGGVTTTRDVKLPKDFPVNGGGYAILIFRVGDTWQDITATRQYKPWGAGAYWALVVR